MAAAEASLYDHSYGHLSHQDIVNTNNPDIIKAYCIVLSFINFNK